jgi:transcriptional regulator with XRE-family HTH domain
VSLERGIRKRACTGTAPLTTKADGSDDLDARDGILSEARGGVRAEIQTFLTTRRARISPEQAGLRERRRVSGLRCDEVALLAGISSQYYTKLERGNAAGVSGSVIDGIARALQLDEAERTHLADLIRAAGTTRAPRGRPRNASGPRCSASLDSMIGTPALVLNARLDIVTANELGYALFSPVYAGPVRPANNARFVFLDPMRPSSSATGTKPPCSAPRPAATPTTVASPT